MRREWRHEATGWNGKWPALWLVGPRTEAAGGLARGFSAFDARMGAGAGTPCAGHGTRDTGHPLDAGGLLRKAMERRIGEHDLPAIARLLRSPVRGVRLAGICMLAEVEWKRVPMPSCEAMFDALKGVRDGTSPALAGAARKVMVRIVEGVLWGGADERKEAA